MLAIETVLAPTDCSDASARAVEYALAVADRYEASLHLLQVLDERVVDGLDSGDVAAAEVAADYQAFAAEVEERVDDAAGVSGLSSSSAAGFSTSSLRRSPGSVVLDAADEVDADFIVIPRETPSSSATETIGKAALYVVEYASQPVLSV
jgi:nucleotide-binding universal stress UspA family protein